MVVYGLDRLDEISLCGKTRVAEINNGSYQIYTICPEDFGLKSCRKEDLLGGDPKENALIVKEILSGKPGTKMDAVLLNAGAALYLKGKAKDIKEGITLAKETIDSGKAISNLKKIILLSNEEAE